MLKFGRHWGVTLLGLLSRKLSVLEFIVKLLPFSANIELSLFITKYRQFFFNLEVIVKYGDYRFRCHGLSVYPVEIRSVNKLSSSEDCSTDYCQPV